MIGRDDLAIEFEPRATAREFQPARGAEQLDVPALFTFLPKIKLGQVAVQVCSADPVVRPVQRPLQLREEVLGLGIATENLQP